MSPSLTRDHPEGGLFCLQPREVWADRQQSAPHTYTECPALPSHPTSFSGGLTTAAGGRGWGAWVRPGGKGASDKGTLCRANFFQDVKTVTIDNPDLGGHQGQGGESGLQSWSAFQQAQEEGIDLPGPPPTFRLSQTGGKGGLKEIWGSGLREGGRHGTEGRENQDEEQKAKDRPEGQRLRGTKS